MTGAFVKSLICLWFLGFGRDNPDMEHYVAVLWDSCQHRNPSAQSRWESDRDTGGQPGVPAYCRMWYAVCFILSKCNINTPVIHNIVLVWTAWVYYWLLKDWLYKCIGNGEYKICSCNFKSSSSGLLCTNCHLKLLLHFFSGAAAEYPDE